MPAAARRVLMISAVLVGLALGLATLPIWVAVAALSDLVSGGRRKALRCGLFLLWYLGCEAVGLLAVALTLPLRLVGRRTFRDANRRLQNLWGRSLFLGARLTFDVRFMSQNSDAARNGPMILLVRHATLVDTLVPTLAVSVPFEMDLRYVFKSELLWDPCLDIVGNRMGHYFARRSAFAQRGASDTDTDLAGVRRLATGLGPSDGIMIYPEGTRFTDQKRARVLEKLEASGDAERLARARSLKNVLPPRLGGTLAALEAAPDADVVLCAHTGLENTTGFRDIINGGALHRTLKARFWRIPRSEVPEDYEERALWLHEQWLRVDRWIDENQSI